MDTPQKPTHNTTRESERSEVLAKAEAAKRAAPIVAKLKSGEKNAVLLAAADALETARMIFLPPTRTTLMQVKRWECRNHSLIGCG